MKKRWFISKGAYNLVGHLSLNLRLNVINFLRLSEVKCYDG